MVFWTTTSGSVSNNTRYIVLLDDTIDVLGWNTFGHKMIDGDTFLFFSNSFVVLYNSIGMFSVTTSHSYTKIGFLHPLLSIKSDSYGLFKELMIRKKSGEHKSRKEDFCGIGYTVAVKIVRPP